MQKLSLLLAFLFLAGCQSTTSPLSRNKQPSNYTKIVCHVKKQNIGNISGLIVFDRNYQTMTLGKEKLMCTSDNFTQCKAKFDTISGYRFYKASVYTNQYPGSGFLDMAEINGKMLTNAAHVEMECNRQ